ncbi:MAG: trypsin-like peptidase domain-containing protein, partial [Desulfatitalea sp.]|nr:trypsin-like peptidase domain-containing protein [Desulfatitalea sp.]
MANFRSQSKIKTAVLVASVLLVAASAQAFDRETPVVQAVRKVGPAVVNISSEVEVHNQQNPFGANPLFDNFFKDFFDPGPQKRVSLGSGVIIDGKRGFILTNAHVLERTATVSVTLQDERQFEACIVGADADSDLAVLQIKSDNSLPSVQMGNSDDIMIGETIIAIGNPFGFSHTVTTGVISAVDRSINSDDRVYRQFIQTDASINPGNSGGPLLNINGELIGINTAIYAKAQGIGFAIPINKAKRTIADLIQYGHVIQAWIGVVVQDIDARLANYLERQETQGVIVTQVEENSPAAKAGLRDGDLILSLGRTKINSFDDYRAAERSISAGDAIQISFWRDGRGQRTDILTTAYPEARAPQLAWRRLGVAVQAIGPESRKRFRLTAKQGVVITEVRPGSY